MKKLLMVSAIALLVPFANTAAIAGGGSSPPVGPVDPGDPGDPGEDPDPGQDPGNPGDNPVDPGTGGGGTTSAPATSPQGSGAILFNLDNLPQAPGQYQPNQQYGADYNYAFIPSNQGVLTQTEGGLTVSLRTADYIQGVQDKQTAITVTNGDFFPQQGVPLDVNASFAAHAVDYSAPGVVYANFSDPLSYFSVNAFRIANNSTGTLSFDVTINAYSGLDGTGALLGTSTVTIGGPGDYAMQLLELSGLDGAYSVTLLGTSLTNYDKITATVAPAAAVPEPAAWATMLLGVGIAGAVARRRRKAVLADA